jgi:hypothetical protein
MKKQKKAGKQRQLSRVLPQIPSITMHISDFYALQQVLTGYRQYLLNHATIWRQSAQREQRQRELHVTESLSLKLQHLLDKPQSETQPALLLLTEVELQTLPTILHAFTGLIKRHKVLDAEGESVLEQLDSLGKSLANLITSSCQVRQDD